VCRPALPLRAPSLVLNSSARAISSQALCWIVQAPLRLLRGCWGMCCRCREGIEESLDGEAHRRDRVWLTLRGPNEVRRRRRREGRGGEGGGGEGLGVLSEQLRVRGAVRRVRVVCPPAVVSAHTHTHTVVCAGSGLCVWVMWVMWASLTGAGWLAGWLARPGERFGRRR
jgi:hypothetical protein